LVRAVVVVLVVLLVLGGLFLLLRPDTPESASRDRAFDISIEGGEMRPAEISVKDGDRVTLRVGSEEPIDFHLHGYDVEQEVEPGQEAKLQFKADLTGRLEIEDHETEKELGVLQVRPR
jgi:hypothetical protein